MSTAKQTIKNAKIASAWQISVVLTNSLSLIMTDKTMSTISAIHLTQTGIFELIIFSIQLPYAHAIPTPITKK
jgi:hypothetical protein